MSKEVWVARCRVEAQRDLVTRRKGKEGKTTCRLLRRADVVKLKGLGEKDPQPAYVGGRVKKGALRAGPSSGRR